jgi:hypothetical protein
MTVIAAVRDYGAAERRLTTAHTNRGNLDSFDFRSALAAAAAAVIVMFLQFEGGSPLASASTGSHVSKQLRFALQFSAAAAVAWSAWNEWSEWVVAAPPTADATSADIDGQGWPHSTYNSEQVTHVYVMGCVGNVVQIKSGALRNHNFCYTV